MVFKGRYHILKFANVKRVRGINMQILFETTLQAAFVSIKCFKKEKL
jgi:hypothetical protein